MTKLAFLWPKTVDFAPKPLHDTGFDWELLKGESEGLLKLPTDKTLLEDPEFRRYVELYAKRCLGISLCKAKYCSLDDKGCTSIET